MAQILSAIHTIHASVHVGGTGVKGNMCLAIIFLTHGESV